MSIGNRREITNSSCCYSDLHVVCVTALNMAKSLLGYAGVNIDLIVLIFRVLHIYKNNNDMAYGLESRRIVFRFE